MSDHIEREALIADFKRMKLGENGLVEKFFADAVYAVLSAFPAADVALVVHGQWKLVRRQADGGEYECSECAHKYVFNSFDRSSNYCPHCGAKMDGCENHATD